MGYNLELQSKKIAGHVNIFDSSMIRVDPRAWTIDATTVSADADGNKILKAGTPLGKISASGKYGPYQPGKTGTKAEGTTKVDSADVKFEGEKSVAYNGVIIAFETGDGEDAAAAWDDGTLTLTLVAATDYGKSALESLIATATTGAPTGVDVEKIAVTISGTKTGTQWAKADPVTLSGGAADVPAADDGRQTAVLMIAEDVDCTSGDQVTTAFDMARVISARLPVTVTAELKSQLSNITFV